MSSNASPVQQMRSMDQQEKLKIMVGLQKYHAVFKKFWDISSIVFSNMVPTAAVMAPMNRFESISMHINPDFWASLSFTQQCWVVSHECLHVIGNHLARGHALENKARANKAMDIVVNHTTIEKFGFKRSEIDPENVYCWMDSFFDPEDNVKSGMNFEYYYSEMERLNKGNNGKLLDEHYIMSQEEFEEFMKKMDKVLTSQEKQSLKQWMENQSSDKTAGNGAGGMIWNFGDIKNVKKKKKWESVIKKWVLKTIGHEEKPQDTWVDENRRMVMLPKDMFIPQIKDIDKDKKEKQRKRLFFFLDTSGSCISLGERFYKAARSLPTDKFEIFLFNFDTVVYEVDIEKAEVIGGAGTSFSIISDKVDEVMKRENLNDASIWILTDGYGDQVTPKNPEKWNWFLTEDGTNSCIPKESVVYKLADYE